MCVISVTVKVQVVLAENLTKGEDVDDEEEGAELNKTSLCSLERKSLVNFLRNDQRSSNRGSLQIAKIFLEVCRWMSFFCLHNKNLMMVVAAILLLLHLLPPTSKGKKSRVKISAKDAAGRLVKFLRVGKSIETFLKDTGPAQPFLLCVGERNDSNIVMDQKAIPCKTQTGVAAFDELFKAHLSFAVSYDEALCNFYTFIQTTVDGIDVGSVKESPRVKEIRARLLHSSV
ncbi:uncharacterized protein [Pseudochaenichthys georgianus]|uniref:uncharacterized protein n=1 Tax=Pseudochaenichthys georgianus TaxID=52239 RepID=UPI0039C2BA85